MRTLAERVYEVGVQHWDRRLFDELIPLPDGTSYNAYLIQGSRKTALLDAVDPSKAAELIDHLVQAGVDKLDYIISHHAEQDHSGSIPDVLLMYPDAKVVTNPKCKGMLMDHLRLEEEQFLLIEDGQELSLGDKTLRFLYTPWVHWPETMCTWLPEDRILFSCDFFGSHRASSRLYVEDEPAVYEAAKRYYAEIMMPFRSAIRGNLKKLEGLDIRLIAPSHGPVYPKPSFILDAYRDWVSDEVKNEVVIAYVSMHDSTRRMVEYFTEALAQRDIAVYPFNLIGGDIGRLAISLVDAATVILASPTVLTGPHPNAAYAAMLINALRPKTRFLGLLGSYGWGGKMPEQLTALLSGLKAEMLPPVIARGYPTEVVFNGLDELAQMILNRHREAGLVGTQ